MWNIAVIDDDDAVRQILTSMLARHSYLSESFPEAKSFISYVSENDIEHIDLIIADIMMPEMDGTQMIQLIAERGILHNIPVLFLSALGEDSDITHAHKAAEYALTVDYLRKPFQAGWLMARVRNLIKLKKFHEEIINANAMIMDMSMEASRFSDETSDKNEYLDRLNQILKKEKTDIQKKFSLAKSQLLDMVLQDLPIVKLLMSILEKNKQFIQSISIGPTDEEELFSILPEIIVPLQKIAENLEKMVESFVQLGIISKQTLAGLDIKSTYFFELLSQVHGRGVLSEETYQNLLQRAQIRSS